MDGRTSIALFTIALAFSTGGCVTLSKKDSGGGGAGQMVFPSSTTTNTTTQPPPDGAIIKKAEDGPKVNPQARTEIIFGEMKEGEADCDAAKADPENQARMRDDARRAYQAALKLDPNNLDAYRHLGRLYVKMRDWEHALDTYKKALAKHPKDATLWYDYGMYHQRRKDLNESVKCFKKALEIDPENRDSHKKLGFTLAWMGRFDEGLVHLTRSQGAALAHLNIARILIERNDKQTARQHVTIALRENRDLPEAQGLLAWLDGPPRPIGALGAPQ